MTDYTAQLVYGVEVEEVLGTPCYSSYESDDEICFIRYEDRLVITVRDSVVCAQELQAIEIPEVDPSWNELLTNYCNGLNIKMLGALTWHLGLGIYE